MAKRTAAATSTEESTSEDNSENTTPERSAPINVGPDQSEGLISAWDGIYYVFGGRFEGYDLDEDGGLVITEFTVDGKYANDVDQILHDINMRPHKPRLSPALSWLNGQEPKFFSSDQDMTTWLVQSFKGSVPDGANRAPKYARDAMASLKVSTGRKRRQGPRKSTISLKNLNQINADALSNADPAGLAHLQDVLRQVLESQSTPQAATSA